ncbi:MAG TPA: hypothetical protein VHY18_04105 [Solirubrobacteraceae bacterium]|jgi:hypothetical protein|nr:hypothetical protein [Solirubrobacteraceae bacterium]
MDVHAQFPEASLASGMYESFYLRAVSPREPVGAWIRYTVEKAPGLAARGSLWVSVFDASAGAPFLYKQSNAELTVPGEGWIAIGGGSRFGPTLAQGCIQSGKVRWKLNIQPDAPELRHFKQSWLYRSPLPRTKLTSPEPAASFDGTIELPGRTLQINGWRGMVGHNWGAEHAARWIWLHGIDFREDSSAWLDVALGRVLVAGRLTPWMASGAICLDGRRSRLGGLGARGLTVAESRGRCSLRLPGEHGLVLEAHVDTPPGSSAEWRYSDPSAHGLNGEHDVVNCSVAALALNVRPPGEAATTLHTAHGAAYELGTN